MIVKNPKKETSEITVVNKPIKFSEAVQFPQHCSHLARNTDKKGSQVIVQTRYKAFHIWNENVKSTQSLFSNVIKTVNKAKKGKYSKSYHLHGTLYVQGTIVSTWHTLSHLILTTNLWRRRTVIPSLQLQIGNWGTESLLKVELGAWWSWASAVLWTALQQCLSCIVHSTP